MGRIFAVSAIAALLAFSSAAAQSYYSPPQNTQAGSVSVSAFDDYFSPRTITVSAGTMVIWRNAGAMAHTVTADNGAFNSGTINPGGTYSYVFSTPGTYNYYCIFHGGPGGVGMAGTVIVTGNVQNNLPQQQYPTYLQYPSSYQQQQQSSYYYPYYYSYYYPSYSYSYPSYYSYSYPSYSSYPYYSSYYYPSWYSYSYDTYDPYSYGYGYDGYDWYW